MKYGLISLDMKYTELAECFALTSAYGFDCLEIFGCRKHLHPREKTESTAQELEALRKKYHVETPMYTPNAIGLPVNLCSESDREREDAVCYFDGMIRFAAEMSIPSVLLVADHPGLTADREAAFFRFSESIRILSETAGKLGEKLVIEPLTPGESPVITRASDVMRLLETVGSDSVYGMMDIAVPNVVGEEMDNYFRILGDRLCYVHLCNNNGIDDSHFLLDRGNINIPAVFELLEKYGYQGCVTAELYTEGALHPEDLIRETDRYLRSIRADKRPPFLPGLENNGCRN